MSHDNYSQWSIVPQWISDQSCSEYKYKGHILYTHKGIIITSVQIIITRGQTHPPLIIYIQVDRHTHY